MSHHAARSTSARLTRAAAALALTAAATGIAAQDAGGGRRGGDGNVPGQIVVKLKSTDLLPGLLAKYPVTVGSTLGKRPLYRLQVIGGADPATVIAGLKLETGVQLAESNPFHQAPEARKNVAWVIGTVDEYRAQWGPQAIRLPEAQVLSTGAGVRVAVIDTGADLQHPALAGRLLPGHDFVDGDDDPSEVGTVVDKGFGHGTHVAGLIALAAPDAKIMPLRVLDPSGAGDLWSIAQALLFAVDPDGNPSTDDGAHVINLSLGTLSKTSLFETLSQIISCEDPKRTPTRDLSDPGYDDDRTRCKTVPGAIVVAAAGNDGSTRTKEYPAAESSGGLLSVAASNATRHIAGFSNSGGWIEIVAPGDGITSAVPGGYATWSGTSMATPLVTGTAALLRALDLTSRPKDLGPRIQRMTVNLCGTSLRQIDAVAVLTNVSPADQPCP